VAVIIDEGDAYSSSHKMYIPHAYMSLRTDGGQARHHQ
jgi:hypothetical protein